MGSKARKLRRNQACWAMNEAKACLSLPQQEILDYFEDPEFQRIHREVREAGEVPKEMYDKTRFFCIRDPDDHEGIEMDTLLFGTSYVRVQK